MDKHTCRSVVLSVCLMLHYAVVPVLADEPPPSATPSSNGSAPATSVTEHSIRVNGSVLDYVAVAGLQPLKDDAGQVQAEVFFVAYTKKGVEDAAERPITFVFNGGPGSSSMWLHLGAVGPKRVRLAADGAPLSPPPQWVANEHTWLDVTDLVCIDAIGTGFSRAAPGVDAARFYEVKQDAWSFAEFIRLYLTSHTRWLSPKFVAGESYGGTRGALLARTLQTDFGIDLNGLLIISPVIDFGTINTQTSSRSTDLAFALNVPTYAATAWYHGRLSPDMQADLQRLVREAGQWAVNEYLPALIQGDALAEETRVRIVGELSHYTGISERYIRAHDLRLMPGDFREELLGDQQLHVSRLDGRFAFAADSGVEYVDEIVPPFVTALNDYLRTELRFETDRHYEPVSDEVEDAWDWGPGGLAGFLNVSDDLSQAMQQNRSMKVLVILGYYDLDVPYFGTEYALNRLGLGPELRANLTRSHYETGHVVYVSERGLAQLKADVSSFIKSAAAPVDR